MILDSDKAFFEGVALATAEKNNDVWIQKDIKQIDKLLFHHYLLRRMRPR